MKDITQADRARAEFLRASESVESQFVEPLSARSDDNDQPGGTA